MSRKSRLDCRTYLLAFFLNTAVCFGAFAQTTIRVPQDQPTIQAGIDAAQNGDTVLVSPGTYAVTLNFNGKAITVTTGATSSSSPQVGATILTAASINPIVEFFSGEGPGSVLNGFTITDPTQPFYTFTTPTSSGMSEASVVDGVNPQGVTVPDASPTITNNRFLNDVTAVVVGGGEIAGNDFSGCSGDQVVLGGNFIHDNVFENGSGSILLPVGLNVIVERNIFRNNTDLGIAGSGAAGSGSSVGIVVGSTTSFVQNLIYGNRMQVLVEASVTTSSSIIKGIIAENTFANNLPSSLCSGSCPVTQILLFKDNYYDGNGFIIANNIFQTTAAGPAIACMDDFLGPFPPEMQDTLQVDHNLFSPSIQPILDPSCRPQITNAGNIQADPQFVNGAGGNYQLATGSVAIDAGNNSLLALLGENTISIATDLAGNPRPVDATGAGYPILDMGAYEAAGVVDGTLTTLLLTPSSFVPNVSKTVTFKAALASPMGTPVGTINFVEDGKQVASALARGDGTAMFSLPPTGAAGAHEFLATYAGDYPYPPADSLKLVLQVIKIATYLQLTAQPGTANPGQPVTLSVLAGAVDGSVPSPVTLTDNDNGLATLMPDVSGNASLVVTTLTPGTHRIVASYASTAVYTASTASVTVTIVLNDFLLSLNPPTVTVVSGKQGRTGVVLTSLGVFSDSLNLTAGPAPQYVSVAFAPTGVSLTAGGTATSMLTIDAAEEPNWTPIGWLRGRSAAVLACGALLILPLGFSRRRWRKSLMVLAAGVLLTAANGCRTISYPLLRAAPGTYLIPITATDPITQISHLVNLTLIVTP